MLFFASIDGPDFSGKTTITNLLVEFLRRARAEGTIPPDIVIKKTELPSNDLVTGLLTDILRNSRDPVAPEVFSLAYAMDHTHHYAMKLRPLEESRGKYLVISERSLLSFMIYQGLLGGCDMEWLRTITRYARRRPDVTYVLRVPVEELVRRRAVENRSIDVFEAEEHIRRQAEVYYNLPPALRREYGVVYVDPGESPFATAEKILGLLVNELKQRGFI